MTQQREKPRGLPRGQHALPRDVVVVAQKRRMHDGVVRAVAEKGYAATTVADVIAEAGVSRSTFYEHFSDKEDCFLSAYDEGAEAHFQEVVRAGARAPDDPFERFRAGVLSYLEQLSAQPDYARTFTIEILATGPAGYERRRRAMGRYVALQRAWHAEMRRQRPELAPLPDGVFEASITAGNEIVAEHIRAGGAARLAELEDLIVYTYLSLLGLPEEAREALERSTA